MHGCGTVHFSHYTLQKYSRHLLQRHNSKANPSAIRLAGIWQDKLVSVHPFADLTVACHMGIGSKGYTSAPACLPVCLSTSNVLQGLAPLHHAAATNFAAMARLLLTFGASPDTTNNQARALHSRLLDRMTEAGGHTVLLKFL